ncbi:MAG: hypothetical protein ACK55X_05455 [Synechococcaceae cyanobacterium]
MAISPVCDAAPPWQVLIGPFAAELIEAERDHGAPLLLVPNNLEQAEELARLFQGRSGAGLFFSRELLGPEDREMCWYRYNDCRFDGVSSPDQLRPLAPNLRLRDLELRPLVRLDSLIHGWANHDPELAALVAAGGGRVWLQCKQPAPIVAGVSRVVEVISEICWTPLGSAEDPALGESVLATVSAWLESSCFQAPERRPVNAHSAAQSLIWRQDPLRLATARAQQLEVELARLREELEGQRQAFAAERQSWQEGAEAERASLAVAQAEESSRLAEEAEALRQELQALRQELEGQRQAFAAERQAFAAEQEALRLSCDAQVRAWQAEREAGATEAHVLAQARESEIAGLQAQLADRTQALVHLQGEAERWHAEAERQRQRLQQAAAEIDAILLSLDPSPDLMAP